MSAPDDVDDHPYGGLPPFQAHSQTSLEAALSVMTTAATDRKRILEFIRSRDPFPGASSDECQVEFGLTHQTGSARVSELLQMGLIIESGRKRKTRAGRNADVYVIAPPGTPPRSINARRKVPKGFTDEELSELYLQFYDLCAFAKAHKKQLHPLIVRLGYWLRENASDAAAQKRDEKLKIKLMKLALTVRCPTCNASPGTSCGVSAAKKQDVHPQRIDLVDKTAKEKK